MPVLENAKHELFAQAVARGATEDGAYAEVYPDRKPGASRRGSASELRSIPIVAARIEELQKEAAKRTVVTVERILKELSLIAFSDLKGAFDEKGNLRPVSAMPRSIRRAIAGVDIEELFEHSDGGRSLIGYGKKVRLWDKVKALELLGKHLKMWTEKHELAGPNGEPLELPPQVVLYFPDNGRGAKDVTPKKD